MFYGVSSRKGYIYSQFSTGERSSRVYAVLVFIHEMLDWVLFY